MAYLEKYIKIYLAYLEAGLCGITGTRKSLSFILLDQRLNLGSD
jgi:hypothetical protein